MFYFPLGLETFLNKMIQIHLIREQLLAFGKLKNHFCFHIVYPYLFWFCPFMSFVLFYKNILYISVLVNKILYFTFQKVNFA